MSDSVVATRSQALSAGTARSTTLPVSSMPAAFSRLLSAAPKNFGGSSIESGVAHRKYRFGTVPETVTMSDPLGRDTATRIFPALPTVRARVSALDDVGVGVDRHVRGSAGQRAAADGHDDDVVVVGEGRNRGLVPVRIAARRPVGMAVLLVERARVQDQIAGHAQNPGLPQTLRPTCRRWRRRRRRRSAPRCSGPLPRRPEPSPGGCRRGSRPAARTSCGTCRRAPDSGAPRPSRSSS